MKRIIEVSRHFATFFVGIVVTAIVLAVFSPIGEWLCSDRTNEISWALFGILGLTMSVLAIVVIGVLYAIGQFTIEQADEVKWAWHRRQYRLHKTPMPRLPGDIDDDFPHST